MAFEKGNYDNCKLKSAQFGSGEYGDQWALKFSIADSGQERTVYLGCGEDRTDKDGKTDLQKTTETMIRLGWNRNFDNPEFNPEVTDPGIQLFMSPSNTTGKERWYVSTGGITLKPPTSDGRNKFMTAFKANAGATKPAGSRPPTAPAKAPPSKAPPAKKEPRVASTKDEAWAHGIKENPKVDEDRWAKAVADQEKASGKAEDKFTPDDWDAVARDLEIPF